MHHGAVVSTCMHLSSRAAVGRLLSSQLLEERAGEHLMREAIRMQSEVQSQRNEPAITMANSAFTGNQWQSVAINGNQ